MRRFSRKYVAVLACAAGGILVAGAIFRPAAKTPPVTAQAADAIPLQRLSRDWTLRQITDYLADTVADLQNHVAYLPEFRATGVEWDGRGTLLTTPVTGRGAKNITVSTPDSIFVLAHEELQHPRQQVLRRSARSAPVEGWVVLVARRPDGELVWRAGLSGGLAPVSCGESSYHEVVFTTELDGTFAGGGVFDLDGQYLGSVGHCGTRFVALASSDIEAALQAGETLEGKLRARYGMTLSELDATAQRFFHVNRGLWITELALAGTAARSGFQIADVLTDFNDEPLHNVQDLGLVAGPIARPDQVFKVIRGGKKLTIPLLPSSDAIPEGAGALEGVAFTSPPQGLLVQSVVPGTLIARSGLSAGDRIIRVNDRAFPDAAQFRMALEGASRAPALVVFERSGVQHAALISE